MKKIKILLIEDDADDVQLLEEAIRDNNIDCELSVIMEGDKVLSYLSDSNPLPDVIVMDFNLPKLHGKEILKLIRATKALAKIPVIVLTTSTASHDMQFAYAHGANRFITKPNTIQGFTTTVETIVSVAFITNHRERNS